MGVGCLVEIPIATPPSSTAGPGDFGEDCLSAKREFRSRPVRRAAQGTPKGRWSWVAFFWLAFLGEARKVTCRRAAPAPKHPREAHKTHKTQLQIHHPQPPHPQILPLVRNQPQVMMQRSSRQQAIDSRKGANGFSLQASPPVGNAGIHG